MTREEAMAAAASGRGEGAPAGKAETGAEPDTERGPEPEPGPDPEGPGFIGRERALEIARARVAIPPNATEPFVEPVSFLGRPCYQCSWYHVVDGARAFGDGIDIWLDARTGRFVKLSRKWRRVPSELPL